jgi:hypothetical protein
MPPTPKKSEDYGTWAYSMNNTHNGLAWTVTAFIGWLLDWFMVHIQAINSVMQFLVLFVSLVAGLYGWRKLRRK